MITCSVDRCVSWCAASSKMAHNIQFLDFTVDPENPGNMVLDIVKKLKPSWNKDDIAIEALDSGVLNKMWCCYRSPDVRREGALMVRVHGSTADGLVSRDADYYGMQLGNKLGCFPSVYGCFHNGVVYKYANGRTANYSDLMDPRFIRDLTASLCRIHRACPQQNDLRDWNGDATTHEFQSESTSDFVRKLVQKIPECKISHRLDTFTKYREEFSDDILSNECIFMETILAELNLPKVLSHNDIHHWNLIINEEDKHVTIIDYELMAMNYQLCDLGFLFVSWHIFGSLGWAGTNSPKLSDEVRTAYVRDYLRAQYESHDKDPEQIPHTEVEMTLTALRVIETMISLRYITTAMFLVNMEKLDPLLIFPIATKIYYENKPQLRTLVDKHNKLRATLQCWNTLFCNYT